MATKKKIQEKAAASVKPAARKSKPTAKPLGEAIEEIVRLTAEREHFDLAVTACELLRQSAIEAVAKRVLPRGASRGYVSHGGNTYRVAADGLEAIFEKIDVRALH